MNFNLRRYACIGIVWSALSFCSVSDLQSQDRTRSRTRDRTELMQFSRERDRAWNQSYQQAVRLSRKLRFPSSYVDERGRTVKLQGLGYNFRPIYYATDNLDAAKIISTVQLWTGEDEEPWLTGEGMEVLIWDGGTILESHQEFQDSTGSRILNREQDHAISNHSTHITGTIGALGIQELAKGMAGRVSVFGWEYSNDIAEMGFMASEGIRVSNHSYGPLCGWDYNSSLEQWYWHGDTGLSAKEDYQFGFYDQVSEDLDYIAWSAPDYLIVKSGGNDRLEAPAEQPVDHYIWDEGWLRVSEEREPDGGSDGYDCLTPMAVAKNILTVGAVDDDKMISSFSAFGPTDDGRIKPDVVAGGTEVYSTLGSSTDSYGNYTGTSMAAASVTGSIALLLQQQEKLQPGVALSSSTLKALLIHTADERGNSPGPDYQYGWGILNIKAAADLMLNNAQSGGFLVREGMISEGERLSLPIEKSIPASDLKLTLCWTDPPGKATEPVLNSAECKLVNDLDVRLVEVSSQQDYFPWKLDPGVPDDPATRGENHLDNIEQVILPEAPTGKYLVEIGHTGPLSGERQFYSLIISGISSPSGIYPPQNLRFRVAETSVELWWDLPDSGSPAFYRIYRNGMALNSSTDTSFFDLDVETGTEYQYYVTAVYHIDDTEFESLASNQISALPRPHQPLPFYVDFEEGYADMQIKDSPEGWLWGDSDSLSCYYLRFEDNTGSFIAANSYTYGRVAHVSDIASSSPLKLAGNIDVILSFDYFFITDIYDARDELHVVYKLPGSINWLELEQLPKAVAWTRHSVSLPGDICLDGTQLGFYYDDLYEWGYGAGIDNISVTGSLTRRVDLAITSMISPVSGCSLSDSEIVVLRIGNVGDTDLLPGERIDLLMHVSTGIHSEEFLVLEDTFRSGEQLEYQWKTSIDLSGLGIYDFDFLLTQELDENADNNLLHASMEITAPPEVSILNEDLDFCEDDPPVLINISPEGGQLIGEGVTGLFFDPADAGIGTHQIIYTYDDQSGCQGSDQVEMVVQSLPQVFIQNGDLSFCEDDPPVLINVSPYGGQLSGPGISGLSFDPEVAGVGTHVIIYTFTAPSGCTGLASAIVVVTPAPEVVIITEFQRFCRNDDPLQIEISPPGGILSGSGITDLFFNPNFAGKGMHICTYTYIDSSGCSGSDSTMFEVFENPWIDLGTDREVGLDDTIELEPMGNGTSFLWYNGSTDRSLSIITSEMGVGEYDVWAEASNLEDCKAIDSILLTISANTGNAIARNPDEQHIYPNPCKTGFFLKSAEDEQIENLVILGSTGHMIMNNIPSTFPYFDISDLPDGLYLLKVRTRTYQRIFKIIKTQ